MDRFRCKNSGVPGLANYNGYGVWVKQTLEYPLFRHLLIRPQL